MKTLFVLGVALVLVSSAVGQNCSQYTASFGPFVSGHNDMSQHINGAHASAFSATGKCIYSGTTGTCASTAQATQVNPSYTDSGTLSVPGFHVGTAAVADGAGSNAAGASTANSEGAVAFTNCTAPGCAFSISLTNVLGGFSLSVPPNTIWKDAYPYSITCPARSAAPCNNREKQCGPPPPSPVVLDTTGLVGFLHGFSDPKIDCVLFDIEGDGHPLCVSWPTVGSGLAWLALPDKEGKVTTGKQLFGNYTPQPNHKSDFPNGFLALAEWDLIQNGGNLDTTIDRKDAVWKRLRLWIDEHCRRQPNIPCVALPSELHRLEEFGYKNIDLTYGPGLDPMLDAWGNTFKFCTRVNIVGERHQKSADSRMACDVWLAEKK